MKKAEAKTANIKHQTVPVVINVMPRVRKGSMVFRRLGSINCGKKAMKNSATLGFKTLVIMPSL